MPPFTPDTKLPDPGFRYIWSVDARKRRNSSFSEAPKLEPRLGKRDGKTLGIRIDGKPHLTISRLDDNGKRLIEATAIVAAQRRRNRGLWVVCAGASGPATLGAATWLTGLPLIVPDLAEDGDGNGEVIWLALHCSYREDSAATGEVKVRPLGEPYRIAAAE